MPSFHWNKIRRSLAASVIGGLAVVSAGATIAEDYPTQPITLVVGFPPGGSTDVVARILAGHMSNTLGQPVLVENRPGAGGTVGISHVASSDPDGYTLGVSGVGASILIDALGRDSGYDIDNDLDVIGVMGTLGLVIAGRNGLEAQTLPELMEFAKANPEALTYGSSGVGTPGHLAMEYLKSLAGVDMLHIPYKGNTPLLNDVVGGHVDIAMLTTPGAAEHVRAENIQPFAVSSPDRSSLMPDVPTVIEGGFEGYTATLWNLLVAPKGTPADVQAKLSDALNEAMKDVRVVGEFATKGLAPTISSPEQATQFLHDERSKWIGVIETAGVPKK
ncbi:tripartite tricarboxylate transporter substrate binding protein [uncultured Roseibium sp.]|uniref:Bug family tripartite tricarboxylate transporter substrate binding protein n=1 Tax=uncultured Roseibium sp. TaxID=1936171 RepID=UPI0026118C8D|nr:tripartite tricarboxylate transporter substrate binding protein [uncultured Roseibium sp.]